MNAEELKVLAGRASTIEGRRGDRLADVHARIRTARRQRAASAAVGAASLVAMVVVVAFALSPGARLGGDPVEPARPTPTPTAPRGPCTAAVHTTPSEGSAPGQSRQTGSSQAAVPGIEPLAGSPGSYGSADGVGAEARFASPDGLAVGPKGTVYVSDFSDVDHRSRIRSVTPDGRVTTVAELEAATWDAGFRHIAVDASDTLYAVLGQTVRRIDPDGWTCVLAGDPASGREDSPPVDGSGLAARFSIIVGMTVAPTGDVYVTDSGSVRRVTPLGQVQTLPTCHNTMATAEGSDCLGWPGTIAVDQAGTVYIGSDDYRIRTIAPDGKVAVLATGDTGGSGLFHRMSIAVDPTTSTLLALDSAGLHRVTPEGTVTTLNRLLGLNLGAMAIGADGTVVATQDQSAIVTISPT